MNGWVVLTFWAAALLFGIVVLGFLCYEISWKLRRVATESARMSSLSHRLLALSAGAPTREER